MTAAPHRSPPASAPPELFARLREETREHHARLETTLDLLARPLSRDRFVHILSRFHGFHAAWEPTIAARPDLAALWPGRERLALIEADLRALGLGDAELAALPRCGRAATLAETAAAAAGSLYVMEGSTLGGQIIARALRTASWTPAAGLGYFDPPGDPGRRWRALKSTFSQTLPAEDWPEVVEGARRTFGVMGDWADRPVPEGGGASAAAP